jgi:hypothetical protein
MKIIKEDEMGEKCSVHEGYKKSVQDFWTVLRDEATRKTMALMG